MKKYLIGLISLVLVTTWSCNKKEEQENGTLKMRFVHQGNGKPLSLFENSYTTANGEAFTAEAFKYYISNIRLRNTQTGNVFYVPESYHLISASRESHVFEFDIPGVPQGSFNELEMSIGVDNAHNSSTDRIGDLDPNSDMAWNWTQGYKFLLFEGKHYPADRPQGLPLVFHIGDNSNYRILRFDLKNAGMILSVSAGKTITAELTCEVTGLFDAPNKVTFKTLSQAMSNPQAGLIADNYARGMFKLASVK